MSQLLDPKTLGDLLDRHGRALQQFASQWSASPEDAVQEAFVRLAKQFPIPENAVAWLYRVTRNLAINELRSEQRRRSHELEKSRLANTDRWERQSNQANSDSVARVLSKLSDEQRELVTLRIWAKLTWQEIADVTGMSTSAAHRKYNAAIEQLKSLWGHHV